MPHAVVEGRFDLAALARAWTPLETRIGAAHLRGGPLYLGLDGRSLLLDVTTAEPGLTQHFFVRVAARDGGVMVRLEPLTDPQLKTTVVKEAIILVARRLRAAPGATGYGATNLAALLDPPA